MVWGRKKKKKIYIYINKKDWVQITLGVILSNIISLITCYKIYILKISLLNYIFYIFLTILSIFISIGCYLPFNS